MTETASVSGTPELIGRSSLLISIEFLLEPDGQRRIIVLRGGAGCGKSVVAGAVAARWHRTGGAVDWADLDAGPAARTGARTLVIADLSGPEALPSLASWQALVRSLRAEDRLLVMSRAPLVMPVDGYRLVELPVRPLRDGALLAA